MIFLHSEKPQDGDEKDAAGQNDVQEGGQEDEGDVGRGGSGEEELEINGDEEEEHRSSANRGEERNGWNVGEEEEERPGEGEGRPQDPERCRPVATPEIVEMNVSEDQLTNLFIQNPVTKVTVTLWSKA